MCDERRDGEPGPIVARDRLDFSDEELALAARVIGRVTDLYDALCAPPDPDRSEPAGEVTPASSH
jgi:hypothetical protein